MDQLNATRSKTDKPQAVAGWQTYALGGLVTGLVLAAVMWIGQLIYMLADVQRGFHPPPDPDVRSSLAVGLGLGLLGSVRAYLKSRRR